MKILDTLHRIEVNLMIKLHDKLDKIHIEKIMHTIDCLHLLHV